jgi:hypothetical protein
VDELPEWESGTAAVLSVHGPHAIPISTAVRASSDRLLFALARSRDTLARLRDDQAAAITVLAGGVAFTAHGFVDVVREELRCAPIVAALELRVRRLQDHLEGARTEIVSAPGWRWTEQAAADADAAVRAELADLAAGRG